MKYFTISALSALLGSTFVAAQYSGEMTYYDVGLGSCGQTSTDDQAVVALPAYVMNNGANPNDNPLCGQTITITYNGISATATILDTCPTCEDGHIDVSPAVFTQFAPESQGVVNPVTWNIN